MGYLHVLHILRRNKNSKESRSQRRNLLSTQGKASPRFPSPLGGGWEGTFPLGGRLGGGCGGFSGGVIPFRLMPVKNLYRKIHPRQQLWSKLRALLSDAPRCIGRCSTLHRLFPHVIFPLSTFNFPLHSLFRLSAFHADMTLS